MTRKRFIKLLMSNGVPIKRARDIAYQYNARKMPYKNAYTHYCLKGMRQAFVKIAVSTAALTNSLSKVAQTIRKFKEAIENQ